MTNNNISQQLKALMEAHTNVSLAKLAEACNVNVAAVRAKAKQPIEGAVYDPNAINYDAIMAYMMKRQPELDINKLDWEAMNVKAERATKTLKESNVDFSVGQSYYLRYYKSVWTIVYATATHVCIMTEGNTQPKVMAKTTFVACGLKDKDFQPADKADSDNK